jgi:hypothetical protein
MHHGVAVPGASELETLCSNCGIPLDAKYFDVFGVKDPPRQLGESVLLAEFELPPQYCGVLEYFAQFTNLFPKDHSKIETPGLAWVILSNGQPLYPYLPVELIVNPWGFGSFEVAIRLEDSARIEFVVRNMGTPGTFAPEDTVTKVGGRLLGRFWYNPGYGDVERGRF